jgi:hypothetical protein
MDWQSYLDNLNEPYAATLGEMNDPWSDNRYFLLQTVNTGAGTMAVIEDGYGTAKLVYPDGSQSITIAEDDYLTPDKLQAAVSAATSDIFSSGNYMENSQGNYVTVVIAPNGQKYPSTDYKPGEGATYAPTTTPVSNPATTSAPNSNLSIATTPNTTPNNTTPNMTTYSYNSSLPNGYAMGPNNTIVQVPTGYVLQGNQYVPGSTTTATGNTSGSTGGNSGTTGTTNPPITLPSGQVISPSDPNYATYAAQAGQTSSSSTNTAANTAQDSANLQAAYDLIDNDANIPASLKETLKTIVADYGGDEAASFTDIMNAFNQEKTAVVDPYYQAQISFLQNQYQQAFNSIQSTNATNATQNSLNATQAVQNEQASLEEAGLTFSGQGVQQLGTQSAVAGATAAGYIPTQNQLYASSTQQSYIDSLQNLGQQVESNLGTSGVSAISGLSSYYTPTQGIVGSEQESEDTALGTTLTDIEATQAAKTGLNTESTLNLGS